MAERRQKRVVIMAGGTGGHIFPALAIAKKLQSENCLVTWLGSEYGLETKIVPKNGFVLDTVPVRNLRGKGLLRYFSLPFSLTRAILKAVVILYQRKPDLVIGLGGFAAGPGGVAAKLLGISLVIHEQNAIPGYTNRLLAKIANRVLLGMPGAFREGRKVILTGNPLRDEIIALAHAPQSPYTSERKLHLLVVGGSLGAQALNKIVPQTLALLDDKWRPQVWQQTGEAHFVLTRQYFDSLKLHAKVTPFIDDMKEAYLWADVVLCRSGASTVSELAAIGKPAIFVPFPFAVDDHQYVNAKLLADANAAIVIRETELTAQKLKTVLTDIMSGTIDLNSLSVQAKKIGKIDATQKISEICLALMDKDK